MTSNTVVLVIHVAPDVLKDKGFDEDLQKIAAICVGETVSHHDISVGNGDRILTIIGKDGSHVSMRVYVRQGFVTVDVYYLCHHGSENEKNPMVNLNFIYQHLEVKIREQLGEKCLRFESIHSPIRRGGTVWNYFATSDERMWEADYDQIVFEKNSKWQNIRIYNSQEMGRVLHLDLDVMYGESDSIYSETLLGVGKERREDYTNKDVLILGGGDGGLIHLLRQENPKMVIMCEIDIEVIKACRTHMRGACGGSMDEFSGPNHKILIGDCLDLLLDDAKNGTKYDYVVNDLTEFPVDKVVKGYCYDFETSSRIMELSLRVLKPGGKYLARGNCWGAKDFHVQFLADVKKLGARCVRRDRVVPSFHETYALYEVWRPQVENNHTS